MAPTLEYMSHISSDTAQQNLYSIFFQGLPPNSCCLETDEAYVSTYHGGLRTKMQLRNGMAHPDLTSVYRRITLPGSSSSWDLAIANIGQPRRGTSGTGQCFRYHAFRGGRGYQNESTGFPKEGSLVENDGERIFIHSNRALQIHGVTSP